MLLHYPDGLFVLQGLWSLKSYHDWLIRDRIGPYREGCLHPSQAIHAILQGPRPLHFPNSLELEEEAERMVVKERSVEHLQGLSSLFGLVKETPSSSLEEYVM